MLQQKSSTWNISKKMMKEFDIAIIGGGHAGCEAAWISSSFDLKVGLISMPGVALASAPCNPAIGGVGKGQVVRELDALGGLMGKLADLAGIQYRILNETKGYAVQSTRAQVDKIQYAKNAEKILSEKNNLEIIRDEILSLEMKDESFIINGSDTLYRAKKIIITAGTFLNAKTHVGEEQKAEGRVNKKATTNLRKLLGSSAKKSLRFKTGTPPRLEIDSLDFSKFIEQKSDPKTLNFHWAHSNNQRKIKQVSCYITHTNEDTLGLIRDNKERSPIFNGQISGVGPRYCPSIEDKGERYPDRNRHHIFVEPESHELTTIYPNGISTSLPKDVQEEFIKTIPGFEQAEIAVYGYAVEYDVVNTLDLDLTLSHKELKGLYFAGQINGTSGYEEAAGQGFIAGVNAAFALKNREPFKINREDSYIGVMIQDLVTLERDEPYRLFTARNENRLYVREDNSINRMYIYRSSLGLNEEIDLFQKRYMDEFELLSASIQEHRYIPNQLTKDYFQRMNYGSLKEITTLAELIRRPQLDPIEVLKNELDQLGLSFFPAVIQAVAISEKYSGYIKRNEVDKNRVDRFNNKAINWEQLSESKNISFECKQRIKKVRPETFGQLKRIDGIRPATLAFVARDLA